MSSLRGKNNKDEKKENKIPAWSVALIVTISICSYFLLGSWCLAFIVDQAKCKNKDPNCMLPGNPNSLPYRPGANTQSGLSDIVETAKSVGENWTILEILKNVFGISPKKPRTTIRGVLNRQNKKQFKQVNNFLTAVDIDGWKPFDIFNGPPAWPYNWAGEPSECSMFDFTQWFGKMQIDSWSIPRGLLYGYFSLFSSLADNIVSRFLLTWAMPVIISLALVLQPIVSFVSSIWANFSAGVPWGILFFFVPIFTVINMILQHIQMVSYIIIGGVIGSGADQVMDNLNIDMKKGYRRIMQGVAATGLLITLILFIVDITKKTAK